MRWGEKRYHSLDYELKQMFKEKVYKIALNGGMTCPNRDGHVGTGGCIFCSSQGSGDFAGSARLSIAEQIRQGKADISSKRPVHSYIAYFQAFTNTYAPVETLRALYMEAIADPEVKILSIATRPDCLGADVLALLDEINHIKPVWVELGLQTIHPETSAYIRRGYELSVFEQAVKELRAIGITVIVHTILYLPGETKDDMLDTIHYLNHMDIQGIKLQLLHVLRNTDLAKDYLDGKFSVYEMNEYIDLVIDCLEHLSPKIVIHRLTGDGPKDLLIAPTWSSAKKTVLNTLHHECKIRGAYQGKQYKED